MHRMSDAALLLGLVILGEPGQGQSFSLEEMAKRYGQSKDGLEGSHFIIYDEVIYDPLGVIEAVEQIVKIRCRDMPVMPRIKPNQYAGDSWRRQGKRRGSPRR